ncbi:hypothetical protein GJAV_G00115160 [Gymnothorax javanicus]|nr:hypothetical protein GJAV_G00115160 [Gymnothorax javanicus]
MDLGKVRLPRTGLNTLHQAIHPVHGLAWTDGKQVCLTSFQTVNAAELKFGDTNVIGQFDHVLGLCWGPFCGSDSPALLAVQYKKHVTVWQVQLSAQEQSKLLCTQTCEMSEPLPLLAQGCVWHPKADVLTLLTKRDASVAFSVRTGSQRVRAGIRDTDLVHCACWTKNGTRLVVAVGTMLHSYTWNDVERTLAACIFCPVYDVGGHVCALEFVGDSQVAATTELPLSKICGLNAGMPFDGLPDPVSLSSSSRTPALQIVSEDSSLGSQWLSVDSDRSSLPGLLSSMPSGPVDLTHIVSRHRSSDSSPLIHLQRRDTLTGSGQDCSHLVIVTFEHKATTSRKLSVPGILVPDIIALDPSGHFVAVASNTCSVVLVYAVSTGTVPNQWRIHLQKSDRPKGMHFLSSRWLLLMVGRHKSSDHAFLTSTNTDEYLIHLLSKNIEYNDEASGQAAAQNPPFPSLRFSEAVFSRDECFRGVAEMPPLGGCSELPLGEGRRLIEEVVSRESSPAVRLNDFLDGVASDTSSIVAEPRGDKTGRCHGSRECRRPDSSQFKIRDLSLSKAVDPPAEQLSQTMEQMFSRFAEVQQCLFEIRDFAQNGRKSWGCYPSHAEPPYATVSCQRQVSESVFIEERRHVLLYEGRLCLRVLQDLFSLEVVEMLHGSLWIVLVADGDGFVPLTFKSKEELKVRDGKQNLPRSPSNSETP